MTELLDYSGELFIFFLTFQGVFIRVNHTLITLSSRKLMHSFFFFFLKMKWNTSFRDSELTFISQDENTGKEKQSNLMENMWLIGLPLWR